MRTEFQALYDNNVVSDAGDLVARYLEAHSRECEQKDCQERVNVIGWLLHRMHATPEEIILSAVVKDAYDEGCEEENRAANAGI